MKSQIEFGDWQTPLESAYEIVVFLSKIITPKTVIDPTCGKGNFLHAASRVWEARIRGYEISEDYIQLSKIKEVVQANFFDLDWSAELHSCASPLLILGNPPWVTNASLGKLSSKNLPFKRAQGDGFESKLGKSNFDISESIIRHLLECSPSDFALAMLCKWKVARNVFRFENYRFDGQIIEIDAKRMFGVSVDAVLLVIQPGRSSRTSTWPIFSSLGGPLKSKIREIEGQITCDADGFVETRKFQGTSPLCWRSGVKHDCSSVMESSDFSSLESTYIFPLMKGSDVANQRKPSRFVLVPQLKIGDSTSMIEQIAPCTWKYLQQHKDRLDTRKSSIYKGQPDFSIFGVGTYTFAPWKIAIAGMYKRLSFTVVGPYQGKPVVFDDTVYFLSFDSKQEALQVFDCLTCDDAKRFFEARVFWSDKRPITKKLLQSFDWTRLNNAPFSR